MELPSTLLGQLASLTIALGEPGTDLQAILEVLVDDVTSAVPSFLGLTMTVQVDGHPVTMSAIDSDLPDAAGSSMSLPLDLITGMSGATVVFYAYNPGAFVDLAADTRRAFDLDGQVVLDGHLDLGGLDVGGPAAEISSVPENTLINQALGVLIARGYPPEDARIELRARADRDGHPMARAAQGILDSTTTGNHQGM